jgi:hypothetical protein
MCFECDKKTGPDPEVVKRAADDLDAYLAARRNRLARTNQLTGAR